MQNPNLPPPAASLHGESVHIKLSTNLLDIGGILSLAVYLSVSMPELHMKACHLTEIIKKKLGQITDKQEALRSQALYTDPDIHECGRHLFDMEFRQTIEIIASNFSAFDVDDDPSYSFKADIWAYLSERTVPKRACSVPGGWDELMLYLQSAPEGWTLYYWAQKTLQNRILTGIFEPLITGDELTAWRAVRKGVVERKRLWASKREEKGGLEARSKSRLFPELLVYSEDRRFKIGLPDAEMVELLVKLYQLSDAVIMKLLVNAYRARWYNVQKQWRQAKEKGSAEFSICEEHPWGELVTELPSTTQDMLAFMGGLVPEAWTLDPITIYPKLNISLYEFWVEFDEEVLTTARNIQEMYNDIAADHC